MSTTIAYDPVEQCAAYNRDDFIAAVASINAIGCGEDNAPVEQKSRWRLTEEEIVRAAITMIVVSLVSLIGLSAGAILTMG
ncbi:hypothetical protein [Mycobacterium asiaticum]|uniref:Uncharacterized protein n=1 Tax=Mycobacterium asiaticum TaxID=1790 RepID=A0A1A3C9E9_MYCAS|nr:hypothetical protein [Mycobacterium asiaticum]OBI83253.1 hypothetical protein A9X01_21135 [Mycobacterium asiaticum]